MSNGGRYEWMVPSVVGVLAAFSAEVMWVAFRLAQSLSHLATRFRHMRLRLHHMHKQVIIGIISGRTGGPDNHFLEWGRTLTL